MVLRMLVRILQALPPALALLAVATPASGAAPEPYAAAWDASPQIVFAPAGSRSGIWTISPQGGAARLLTNAGGADGGLAVSPNGKTLLFGSGSTLYRIPLAGGTPRALGTGFNPAWSPDGRRIAFTRNGGVYVMQADGTGARKVVTNRYIESAGAPTWSPDGRKLAYVACSAPYLSQPCEHQYGFDVYVIGLDGSDKHKVTPKRGLPQCPAWSHVAKLAFLSTDNTVAIVRAGGGLRTFRPGGCPVWAPGGRRFATTTATGVYLMNADGSGRRRITILPGSHTGFTAVAWSKDGRTLAVVGGEGVSHLWVVKADGTGLRRLV
jgi:Tol biopolymer transport system component